MLAHRLFVVAPTRRLLLPTRCKHAGAYSEEQKTKKGAEPRLRTSWTPMLTLHTPTAPDWQIPWLPPHLSHRLKIQAGWLDAVALGSLSNVVGRQS